MFLIMLPMVTYRTHRTVLDYWVSDKAWPQTSLGMDWVQGQSGQVIKIYLFCNECHFIVFPPSNVSPFQYTTSHSDMAVTHVAYGVCGTL